MLLRPSRQRSAVPLFPRIKDALLKSLAIRNQKNFAAGLLYIAIGMAFAIGATNYKLGLGRPHGAGLFPVLAGPVPGRSSALVVLAGSLRARAQPEALPHFDLKTLAWLLGSVVLFGVLLHAARPGGLAGGAGDRLQHGQP